MIDLYAVLGIKKDASKDEIKGAYRRKAKEHHPDSGSKPSSDAFNAATKAYRLLSDDARRRDYDETGNAEDATLDDPLLAKAMGFMSMAFNAVMDRPDVLSINLPLALERALNDTLNKATANVAAGEKELRKMQRAKEKLKRKKDRNGDDHIMRLLDIAITGIQRPLDGAKLDVSAIRKAIELLDAGGYEFTPDTSPLTSTMSLGDMINSMARSQQYDGP